MDGIGRLNKNEVGLGEARLEGDVFGKSPEKFTKELGLGNR